MHSADFIGGRRFGLDWLRIGAFALLILYHIGMYFVSWDWHVKSSSPLPDVELVMLAINPWRLALLFLISGIVSRALLGKLRRPREFALQRTTRLLIPLVAGIVLFVAPQAWVELRVKGGYAEDFVTFWWNDYFEFGATRGVILPTYNHLWFVAYLWVYTLCLALLAATPASSRARAQRAFDWLFGGGRVIVLPLAWLFAARMLVYPHFPPTHALVDDLYHHLVFAFAFFFGVGLARSPAVWKSLAAKWQVSAIIAVAGYLMFAAIVRAFPDSGPQWITMLARASHSALAWGAIAALIAVAQLHLHRDGPVRRYLTDAIFPFYIAHQTIIVAVGYWLLPFEMGAGPEFAILLLATLAGCFATYEIGRRVRWLRPLIGLKWEGSRAQAGIGGQSLATCDTQ